MNMNMEGHLEEEQPPAKKSRIGESSGQADEDQNEEKHDALQLLESLSREDLIKLVRNQNEAAKKETEKMAKQHQDAMEMAAKQQQDAKEMAAKQQQFSKEMATKVKELKTALLATQHNVEELAAEMANVQAAYRKQNEELRQRIAQLPQEFQRQMKIQMAKETWFDMLEFVSRRQLGQIVPYVGRQFARIVQPFLHNYGQLTLGNILINPPESDLTRCPTIQVGQSYAQWYAQPWGTLSRQLVWPAEVPMPENIKDFISLEISYLHPDVLNFLRQLQQNTLFGSVNLSLQMNTSTEKMDTLLTTLSYVLPLIRDNINSIQLMRVENLRDLYNAKSDMAIAMLKMPRILGIRLEDYQFEPENEEITLLNRWLYTPRDDGKPRVLCLPLDVNFRNFWSSNVLQFMDNLKEEFTNAKSPVCFFIRLFMRESVEWHNDICMVNRETKEKLVIKTVALTDKQKLALEFQSEQSIDFHFRPQKVGLISRHPLNAGKEWVEANEQEALHWDFDEQNRKIHVDNPMKNAIPHSFEHSSAEGREAHYQNIRFCDCFSNANDGREDQGGSRDNDGVRRST